MVLPLQLTDVDKEDGGTYDPAYPTSRGGDKKQAAKDESDEEEVSAHLMELLPLSQAYVYIHVCI